MNETERSILIEETALLIGYARVSTIHQNLDRQLGSLRAAGCETVFAEKASGKDAKGRPELENAIDALGTGDVLVLAEWDRATRSMFDGITIMQRVHARGAAIRVLVVGGEKVGHGSGGVVLLRGARKGSQWLA